MIEYHEFKLGEIPKCMHENGKRHFKPVTEKANLKALELWRARIAALSTFTWNFFAGAGLQILAGIFGVETPQIVLFGRAAIIGFIYGATIKSIAYALKYDVTHFGILVIVLLGEFLAYSIATHGGLRIGKSVGKLENGTRKQRLVNSLVGPLPFTYNKVKHELKREIRSAARLCPTIAAILLFTAMLEIWLILS